MWKTLFDIFQAPCRLQFLSMFSFSLLPFTNRSFLSILSTPIILLNTVIMSPLSSKDRLQLFQSFLYNKSTSLGIVLLVALCILSVLVMSFLLCGNHTTSTYSSLGQIRTLLISLSHLCSKISFAVVDLKSYWCGFWMTNLSYTNIPKPLSSCSFVTLWQLLCTFTHFQYFLLLCIEFNFSFDLHILS